MKRRGISVSCNVVKVSKACKGPFRSQSLFMARPEAKRARMCSTKRRRADLQQLQKVSKACKGPSKSQSLFMARPEAKRARICSTKRRRADPQQLQKVSKTCKGPIKSQSLCYGETRSQAGQDLLDQAKASKPSNVTKSFYGTERLHESPDLFDDRTGS